MDGQVVIEVLDCDCRGPNECHIEFGAAGAICVGDCPPGFECITTTTTNPDGTVTMCCQCLPCVDPPGNMTAWWPLDELTGTTSLELVNGNNGTHFGGPTPLSGAFVDHSLCFDGLNDYVEVPDAPALNFGTGDFSMDAWIRTTDTAGVKVILDKRLESSADVTGYSLFLGNGILAFQIADDGSGGGFCGPCPTTSSCTNYGSGAFVATGQWVHVAVTVSRVTNGGTFYVNGAAVGIFNPDCHAGTVTNPNPLRIGSRSSSISGLFIGCVDEVELFNRALTAAEVASIHGAGQAGKCKEFCQPLPSGQGCTTTCPAPGLECVPTKIRYNSQTGQSTVLECDCLPQGHCHVGILDIVPPPPPVCVGSCPDPTVPCQLIVTPVGPNEADYMCVCQTPVCAPIPGTLSCSATICPGPAERYCLPICVRMAGQMVIEVLDCDCRGPTECHLEIGAAGVMCVGNCPAGFECITTTTPNPDGTVNVCCQCVPVVECAPTTDGQSCVGPCPNPALPCLPVKVKYYPATGQYVILDCDCRSPNECHVEIVAGATPFCAGVCPDGTPCQEIITPQADGSIVIMCMCGPPYQNWVIADDFCIGEKPCACSCDINADGVCNTADLALLFGCLDGTLDLAGCDVNCDGVVNGQDVITWECLASGLPPEQCCPSPPTPPINLVRWYGSYLDPAFEPPPGGGPPQQPVDGWLVALHRDIPAVSCPPTPPGFVPFDHCGDTQAGVEPGCVLFQPQGSSFQYLLFGGPPPGQHVRICGFLVPNCITTCQQGIGCVQVLAVLPCDSAVSRPGKLIAQWEFPPQAVSIVEPGKVGCDGHRIFCYQVDLPHGCLVHNNTLPGELDSTGIFHPIAGETYWISVQAEVGHVPCCDGCPPTGQVATQDFWGWHTTPVAFHHKDDAFMGMLGMGCHGEWLYNWMHELHWSQPPFIACADDPTKSIDMAFCLYTALPGAPPIPRWCQPLNPGPQPPGEPLMPVGLPDGGIDTFAETNAMLVVQPFGLPPMNIELMGPTVVTRGSPMVSGDQAVIDTEIIAMELTGFAPQIGPIGLREDPMMPSHGRVIGNADDPLPAQSFFDVFIIIDLPNFGDHWISEGPVHVESLIYEVPPAVALYTGPPTPVTLISMATGQPVGVLLNVQHGINYRGGVDIHSDTDWANMPMSCSCNGDLNGDGGIDGVDIGFFVKCFIEHHCAPPPPCPPLDCPCLCADVVKDGMLTAADIAAFIDVLLGVAEPACP